MYNRVVDDLMSWMDDVESQLMSEDHGKDLYSVNKLLKKHQVRKTMKLSPKCASYGFQYS